MRVKILGFGAAGNKAAIECIKQGIIAENDVALLNTTLKDIPETYKDLGYLFSSDLGGCGKERNEGKKAMIKAIQSSELDMASFVDDDTQLVCLVASTEGGSGSGSINIAAKYYQAMNIPVHVFSLIGFNDDVRGIKNTLAFFKDLDDGITLHTISNTEFLDYSGNHSKAEQLANEYFAEQVEALIGNYLIPSDQNIDDKDMYKIVNTTGYMNIQKIDLSNVKNPQQFTDAVVEAYQDLKGLEFDKSCKRLGVIINVPQRKLDVVDHTFEVIKRYIGEPYETFRHIQDDGENEYMYIIASGLNFPSDGIKRISKIYKDLNEKVNRETNSFKDIFSDIDLDDEDDEFDMSVRSAHAKSEVDKLFGQMVIKKDENEIVEKTNVKNVVKVTKNKGATKVENKEEMSEY